MMRGVSRLIRPNDDYQIDLEAHTIRSFVMFMGFGRSGHSIVGQIINAHPNALVADEAAMFEDLGTSPSLEQTIDYLKTHDRSFSRRWYNKDLKVHNAHPVIRFILRAKSRRDFYFPGLSQGAVKLPSVIGNSKAGYTSRTVAQNPDWISSFEKSIGIPVKLINIIRNPYDMIASGIRRREASFEEICSGFEQMAEYVSRSLEILADHEILKMHQEDLLNHSEAEIRRLFEFLELPLNSQFTKIVSSRLFPSPDKSRHRVPEMADHRERIDALIAKHDFFDGYSYES
jgi:hypothetical protein